MAHHFAELLKLMKVILIAKIFCIELTMKL